MTRAHGKRQKANNAQAVEIGRAARRAGLTLDRTLSYYAYDAERLPQPRIQEGWEEQDAIYLRAREAMDHR